MQTVLVFCRNSVFRSIAITACLVFGASAAQAAVVQFGTDITTKAIGITNLDIDGTLYNVLFPERVPAAIVYGEFPGTFTFTIDSDAQAAVLAVNAALNGTNALTVGEDTPLDINLNLSFNIAYESSGPSPILGLAVFQTGGYASGWFNLGSGNSSWAGEERTWATFEVATVPVPAAAWLFGTALLGLGALKRKKA